MNVYLIYMFMFIRYVYLASYHNKKSVLTHPNFMQNAFSIFQEMIPKNM